MNTLIKKAANLPVGAIATSVGLATLSNVYLALGFPALRHITMILVSFVWLAAAIKITVHFNAFKEDYNKVVPASLYGTFTMLTMILGSYVFGFHEWIGRSIWLFGLILHMVHILVFTYRNVIKNFKKETFLPSWFVTYVGILVSVTVGTEKGMPVVLTGIVIYGLIIFAIILPFMLYRMMKYPVPAQFGMTRAVFLAPTSLVFVGYLNVVEEPVTKIVFALYALVFIAIIYVARRIPKFFNMPFNPAGHPAFTFPSAIALVATFRMSNFLVNNGYDAIGEFFTQFFGIQLWVTTAIMAYIAFNFVKIFIKSLDGETFNFLKVTGKTVS